jgi:hypothetical protein
MSRHGVPDFTWEFNQKTEKYKQNVIYLLFLTAVSNAYSEVTEILLENKFKEHIPHYIMKQLVEKIFYIKVNDFDEHKLTCRKVIRYTAPKITFEEFRNFNMAYDFIKNNDIHCCRAEQTLFRKKPRIVYGLFDDWNIEKKNFEKLIIKCEYRPVKEILTMRDLIELLPAEQFAEWLKDNKITKNLLTN